jgi:nucleotide-binding universal stress UspA family protein
VSFEVSSSLSAASAILDAAKSRSADLVAVATHGRGASRFVLGSVADKVLRGTSGAVLVVRPRMVATDAGPH